MKSWLVVSMIVLLIGAGISYMVNQSPDRATQLLFNQTLKIFAENAVELESDFLLAQRLKIQQKEFVVTFESPLAESQQVKVKMEVATQSVTLKYSEQSSYLAGQSIILEPKIEADKVIWRCINGNVLVRVRSKNCRLGVGETRAAMLDY